MILDIKIDFESQILAFFDNSALCLGLFNFFLCVPWELDNPYYHSINHNQHQFHRHWRSRHQVGYSDKFLLRFSHLKRSPEVDSVTSVLEFEGTDCRLSTIMLCFDSILMIYSGVQIRWQMVFWADNQGNH